LIGSALLPDNPRLLAFDCAAGACSAAVWSHGRVVAGSCRAMTRGQAEVLLPMVAGVMREAGMGFADLDGLAVTVGPGSFTGVRVGLAAARGFALASGLPVVAMTTFEAVGASVDAGLRVGRTLAVAIDSKRGGDVYLQVFHADGTCTAGAAVAPDAIAASIPPGPVLVVGDGQEAVIAALGTRASGHPARHPDARVFAVAAVARLKAGPPPALPSPLYLRAPDVTPPRAAEPMLP